MLSGSAALFARERPPVFDDCSVPDHWSITPACLLHRVSGPRLTDPPTSLMRQRRSADRHNPDLSEREVEGGRLGIYSETGGAMTAVRFLLGVRRSGKCCAIYAGVRRSRCRDPFPVRFLSQSTPAPTPVRGPPHRREAAAGSRGTKASQNMRYAWHKSIPRTSERSFRGGGRES